MNAKAESDTGSSGGISRRAALQALGWCLLGGKLAGQDYREPRLINSLRSGNSLSQIPILNNSCRTAGTVEVSLTAGPARLPILDGCLTNAFAYNGRIPGPTLAVREGDRVIVHFRNNLPEPTTVHWHGLHIPFKSDGSPFHPVPAGETHDYVFTVPLGTAGTYWYHPHPNHRTGYQVAMGLYGGITVRAANDPLPETLTEQLLILSDNRFLADGSVDLPDPDSQQGLVDMVNGREGNVIFVNGQILPTLTIGSGELQRWRIINASAARVYRLAISGQTFLHVGSDGGLFERPVKVREIVIANGERVELLVRGEGLPEQMATLQTLPYDRYVPQTKPTDWDRSRDLMKLRFTQYSAASFQALPEVLRAIPALDPRHATATRVIAFSQGLINGKTMDMNRVDVSARLGATEIWQIENLVGMDHPFHLHGFQFQILERNGVPEQFCCWKDMVNVPKHETARFIVRYDDNPGKWMFHCHILDHEDHGMMGILEVT